MEEGGGDFSEFDESEVDKALQLSWIFGMNKDLPNAVHHLGTETRRRILYVAGHVGIIYDLDTHTQTLLQGHTHAISAVAVSRDKRWIVTADEGSAGCDGDDEYEGDSEGMVVVVWRASDGVPIRLLDVGSVLSGSAPDDGDSRRLRTRGRGVCSVAISHDNRYVATLSYPRIVRGETFEEGDVDDPDTTTADASSSSDPSRTDGQSDPHDSSSTDQLDPSAPDDSSSTPPPASGPSDPNPPDSSLPFSPPLGSSAAARPPNSFDDMARADRVERIAEQELSIWAWTDRSRDRPLYSAIVRTRFIPDAEEDLDDEEEVVDDVDDIVRGRSRRQPQGGAQGGGGSEDEDDPSRTRTRNRNEKKATLTPALTGLGTSTLYPQLDVQFHPSDARLLVTNSAKRVLFWSWEEGRLKFYSPPCSKTDFKRPVGEFTMSTFIPGTSMAATGTKNGEIVLWQQVGLAGVRMDSDDVNDETFGGALMMEQGAQKRRRALEKRSKPTDKRALKVVQVHKAAINVLLAIQSNRKLYIVTGGMDGYVRFFDFQLRLQAWFEEFDAGPLTSISFMRSAAATRRIERREARKEERRLHRRAMRQRRRRRRRLEDDDDTLEDDVDEDEGFDSEDEEEEENEEDFFDDDLSEDEEEDLLQEEEVGGGGGAFGVGAADPDPFGSSGNGGGGGEYGEGSGPQKTFDAPDFIIGTSLALILYVKAESFNDFEQESIRGVLLIQGQEGPVQSLAVHPTQPFLAISGLSGHLHIWDYEQKRVFMLSVLHKFLVSCIAFDPKGEVLAVGTTCGVIKIMDAEKFVVLQSFHPRPRYIQRIVFSHDSQYFAYSDDTNCIGIFKYTHRDQVSDRPVEWVYLGRCRSHKSGSRGEQLRIADFAFGVTPYGHVPRLMSLGQDRRLVEYDLEESSIRAGIKVKSVNIVGQSAHPTAMLWSTAQNLTRMYPKEQPDYDCLLVCNDHYKFLRHVTPDTGRRTRCTKTFRCPTFGGSNH